VVGFKAYAPELDKDAESTSDQPTTHGGWMRLILKSREMEVLAERWIRRATPWTLLAKRDAQASVRFFRKMLNATHTKAPRVINVDKNAAYPKIDSLKASEMLPETGTSTK